MEDCLISEVGCTGGDGDLIHHVGMNVGADPCVLLLLGRAFDEQLAVDVFGGKGRAGAKTLCGELGALDVGRQTWGEVDVIVDAGGVIEPQVAIQNGLDGLQAKRACGTEGIMLGQFGAVKLREGDGGDALECRLERCADGA